MASGLFATGPLTTIGLADGGGITYGVPLGFALSKSMTTVLRSARTRCATACDRLTRTRGLPPASPGSIATPAIGPFAFAAKLARPSTETLRRDRFDRAVQELVSLVHDVCLVVGPHDHGDQFAAALHHSSHGDLGDAHARRPFPALALISAQRSGANQAEKRIAAAARLVRVRFGGRNRRLRCVGRRRLRRVGGFRRLRRRGLRRLRPALGLLAAQ